MTSHRGPTIYRPTLEGIAKAAGVSRATVDRVLNNRHNVRSQTRSAVLEAMARLGATPADLGVPREQIAEGRVSVDVVVPAYHSTFFSILYSELKRQAADRTDMDIVIHEADAETPQELAEAMLAVREETRGVAIVAMDHPLIREAIRALSRRNVKVVTMVSDIQGAPRLGYVGVDNRSAGRLAGYLASRIGARGPRQVALIHGLVTFRGQEEREMGFKHFLAEQSDLHVVEVVQTEPEPGHDYAMTRDLLNRYPQLAIIYNMSSGNREIAQAIQDAGRADSVVFIGHDLTDRTKEALLAGTMDFVIDQNPRVQVRDAYEQLFRSAQDQPWNAHPLRIQVICRENIPED
jgi:LacI family transcriptional regulator